MDETPRVSEWDREYLRRIGEHEAEALPFGPDFLRLARAAGPAIDLQAAKTPYQALVIERARPSRACPCRSPRRRTSWC